MNKKLILSFLFVFLTVPCKSYFPAEYSLSLGPLVGVPLGRPGDWFGVGTGAELQYRQQPESPYLKLLRRYNLQPAAALSFVGYSLKERSASRLLFFQSWLGVGYPISLRFYQLQIIPRLGAGIYYGDFLMAGRDSSLPLFNFLLHAGNSLQYPLNRELLLEFSQGFTAAYVGKPVFFPQLNFALGFTLRIGVPPIISSPVAELRQSLVQNYDQGNYAQASREIDALEKMVPDDLLIEKYRSLIYQQYRRQEAAKHRQEGRIYRAIALLKQAPDLPEAAVELSEIRESLAPQIKNYLAAGIAAYEKEDFDTCIANMEKILLIEPNHPEAQIYLPRAANRRKALQRLK